MALQAAETGKTRLADQLSSSLSTWAAPTKAHGSGPKATPLFRQGKLYTLGISGASSSAFDASTGNLHVAEVCARRAALLRYCVVARLPIAMSSFSNPATMVRSLRSTHALAMLDGPQAATVCTLRRWSSTWEGFDKL